MLEEGIWLNAGICALDHILRELEEELTLLKILLAEETGENSVNLRNGKKPIHHSKDWALSFSCSCMPQKSTLSKELLDGPSSSKEADLEQSLNIFFFPFHVAYHCSILSKWAPKPAFYWKETYGL